MKRTEQKQENTWNLEKMYSSKEELKENLKKAQELVEQIVQHKDNLYKDKEAFQKTNNTIFEYEVLMSKCYTYAHHKLDEDLSNSNSQELLNEVYAKYVAFTQQLNFLTNEIMDHKKEILNYLKDEKFGNLRKYYDNILRYDQYTLSKKEEKIISLTAEMSAIPYKAYNSLVDSEFTFEAVKVNDKEEPLTQGTYNNFITNPEQKVRQQAFQNLYKPFKKHIDTIAILYNGQINTSKFTTRARGYKSNIEKSLFSTNIDPQVYHNLINSINDNLEINHNYVKFRKENLEVQEFHLYDMYVPLVADVDKEISFEEAEHIILDCFEILGQDYKSVLKKAFQNRWIDIYENESKRSGAYSGGTYSSDPYILLNYTNKINDLYTLAHELGHSLHTYFTNQTQEFHNSHYKIFIAEVASIVNELLLTNYLLEKTEDKKYKSYILNYLLEQFRTTLIRQTMFAEFEIESNQLVEKAQDLTAKQLNELYYSLNQKYFGKDIIIDEEIKYEWARIPHFYYDFYVYQYATSFCASIKIANNIIKDPAYIKEYLKFLKMGDSVYPLEALKEIGIDLSKKEIIDEAMETYQKTLNEFKDIYV